MLSTTILFTMVTVTIATPFWLTVEVTDVEWRDNCLTTSLCSQPRFQILEDLLPISERVSTNWPISKNFVKDAIRPFTSFWPQGQLQDISLSGQVVGVDRTYGFPRICDQTPSIRIFSDSEDTNDVQKVQLRAKCFNATMTITRHTERCPWCTEPAEIEVIGHEQEPANAPVSEFLSSVTRYDEKFIHIGIMVLAMISVLSSAAFALVLVLYLKTNRSNRQVQIDVKSRGAFNETAYNMPWDQCKPLTFWSQKSDSGIASPIDSSFSSTGTPMPPSIDVLRQLTPPCSRYLDV